MDLAKLDIWQPKVVTDTDVPVRRPGRPRMKDSLPIDPKDNSVG